MSDRIWTISNSISLLRVVLVIPLGFALLDEPPNRDWAAIIIIVAVLTDFLDGFLARALHQVSEVGKIVDPLADKISIAALVVFLLLLGEISLWFALVVVMRDLLILFGGLYIRNKKRIITQSNWPGKVAVSFVALYLLLSVYPLEALDGVRVFALWASVATMTLSLAIYARRLFIGRAIGRSG